MTTQGIGSGLDQIETAANLLGRVERTVNLAVSAALLAMAELEFEGLDETQRQAAVGALSDRLVSISETLERNIGRLGPMIGLEVTPAQPINTEANNTPSDALGTGDAPADDSLKTNGSEPTSDTKGSAGESKKDLDERDYANRLYPPEVLNPDVDRSRAVIFLVDGETLTIENINNGKTLTLPAGVQTQVMNMLLQNRADHYFDKTAALASIGLDDFPSYSDHLRTVSTKFEKYLGEQIIWDNNKQRSAKLNRLGQYIVFVDRVAFEETVGAPPDPKV